MSFDLSSLISVVNSKVKLRFMPEMEPTELPKGERFNEEKIMSVEVASRNSALLCALGKKFDYF